MTTAAATAKQGDKKRARRKVAGKTTLADVAARAGVSVATVSRAMNTPERVKGDLRARVDSAVAALAYIPDGAARALASSRTRTIGAVVPTLDIAIFAQGVSALQKRLNPAGYTLFIANAEYDPKRELMEIRALVERGVDALVLVGQSRPAEAYSLLESNRVPFVTTYLYDPAAVHPCIGIDNHAASYRMCSYLIDLGHRAFGVVTSPTGNNDRIGARHRGILDCLAEHGLSPPPERDLEIAYSLADGRTALRSLLTVAPEITAVVCTTDMHAIGALLEARSLGVEVPRQLSVSGFDGLDLAAEMEPPLTTVDVPANEMGERVGDYLINRLDDKAVPLRTALSASLVVRGSTGRPRSGRLPAVRRRGGAA